MASSPLLLGPMLRYVDETSASIWVETRADCRVTVEAEGSPKPCCVAETVVRLYA